jgi:hypothetical protein
MRTLTHYTQDNFTHKVRENGREILHGYVELCTNKKERRLKPRNRNPFALREGATFHLSESLSPKRKTANTQPTEPSTVEPQVV